MCNDKHELIYEQVCEQNPDIITFQELPSDDRNQSLIARFIQDGYRAWTNCYPAHAGYAIILIKDETIYNQYKHFNLKIESNIDPKNEFAGIMIKSNKNGNDNHDINFGFMLFGVHLHPCSSKSDEKIRNEQFDRLFQVSKQYGMEKSFILIGDTNMRQHEEDNILKQYEAYDMQCGWNIMEPEQQKHTFSTTGFFRESFDGARARYDKIFYTQNIRCKYFNIFDKNVSENEAHFLSDHRAIVADIDIYDQFKCLENELK